MEEMEVTPVPLDSDVDQSENINSSNPLIAKEVNNLSNSLDAISEHSENDKPHPSITEESAVEIKSSNISIACLSAKLPEILNNVQLGDGQHVVERNVGLNAERGSENETVINYVGNCESVFQTVDDACSTNSVPKSAVNQYPTDISDEKIQNVVCSTDTSSTVCTTASVLEDTTNARDFTMHTLATKEKATKEICEMQTIQSFESESECDLSKTSTGRKECDITDKPFQIDSLQKQSSEIKERVMGFLTKYTITEEASCSNHPSAPSISKRESLIEKQTHNFNEETIGSKIDWKAQCDTVNSKKISNNATTHDTEQAIIASPATPKFNLASVSKNSVLGNFLQTSDPKSMTTQQTDAINQQTIFTKFISQVPSQGGFNFGVSSDVSHSSTSISTSCKNECSLITSNDLTESHKPDNSPKVNTVCSFQSTSEIKMNSFEQAMRQNCQSYSLESDVQSISVYGIPGKIAKGMKQQNELNPAMSDEFLFPSNNDIFGNKMQFPQSQETVTSPFSVTSMNRVTCTFQRSTNRDSVNSFLSWGKMSGELQTTHSINSPILSSKSSNSSSSKHIPFSDSSYSRDIWPDNTELAPQSDSKSRRTRSSDSMFYNFPKPYSNGATAVSSNAKSKSQKSDDLCLVKPGETVETDSFHSSFNNCGNTSKMSFIPQHNINNSQSTFGNYVGKSSFCASGETLHSDYNCFERSFENNITKGNVENPFIKKSPIESIGLFKSPIKSTACETENGIFKSVSSLLFPPKTEKTEKCTGIEDGSGILKPATSNDTFGFSLGIKNKHDQATNTTSAEFVFSDLCSNKSFSSTNKTVSNCEQTSNKDIGEQTPFGKFERVPSQINSNSLFQFSFTPEKSKTFCTSTVTVPRSRKPTRSIKQFQKVTLKDMKGNIPSNVSGKGAEEIPFKPVYGSDVKFEKGMYKNVIVRYQNIVFMDDHTNVSPEELRSQFYSKAVISGPFKFGACIESPENLSKGCKKTQNQETQTCEKLASKNPDLNAIWRVLECPVCLDVVLPPVYQCEQGHHACATCWTKVLTCPLCKRAQSCTRNYMAEALVEQVPLPCRYHIEGCKETVQHNNKVIHEENCSYRMYQCPVPMCNQALSYPNMCKHFKKHHKNILHHEGHSVVGKGEKFCDVLYKEALLSSLVHAFDITKWGLFFLREVAVGHSTAFFVQVMPAVSDQAVYFYHLEVCDHHDCRKECFKGRVFPMCKPSQDIINQEEYLCLSELILKTVKKSTPLKIVVTIWQLKPSFTLSS
ncbi:hypothetical protein R5R35_012020 [Gryllus longicercus]|uniref:RING-type E3 ubiquitin transferase n=1 Tax=Gryllus longicercus TaxID=2509291 RepID=A0AAN9VRN9_9ORTH